jgi:hypothetical protein
MLGTFKLSSLESDLNRSGLVRPGAFALAHDVAIKEDVEPVIQKLIAAGGTLLRSSDAPPDGGFWRVYG